MSLILSRFLRSAVVVIVATGVTSLAAQAPAGGRKSSFGAPPPGALIAPGEVPNLTLLYTGNVIGYLDPCG